MKKENLKVKAFLLAMKISSLFFVSMAMIELEKYIRKLSSIFELRNDYSIDIYALVLFFVFVASFILGLNFYEQEKLPVKIPNTEEIKEIKVKAGRERYLAYKNKVFLLKNQKRRTV